MANWDKLVSPGPLCARFPASEEDVYVTPQEAVALAYDILLHASSFMRDDDVYDIGLFNKN